MIRQIAPQFFTTDLPATLAYYGDALGFECLGTWHNPPVYAIARHLPLFLFGPVAGVVVDRVDRRRVMIAADILRAALALADAEGLDGVSMRRVADRLGVGTMSLYTYIPSKAELLDLMKDSVIGESVPVAWA